MTQTEILNALAEKCEITKKVSQALLAALSDTAISEVQKNGIFVLPGIGRLVRVDRTRGVVEPVRSGRGCVVAGRACVARASAGKMSPSSAQASPSTN